MQLLAFASVIIMALYIPANSYVLLFAITFLFNMVYPNILPGMESGATVLMQTERIHYGKSRSYGSLGYTIALLIVGGATALWQEGAILWVMLAGLIFMAVTLSATSPAQLQIKPQRKSLDSKQAARQLLKSKSFMTLLLVATLLQGAHAAYYNFGFLYLQDTGVSSFYIGFILNIAILFEILFLQKRIMFSGTGRYLPCFCWPVPVLRCAGFWFFSSHPFGYSSYRRRFMLCRSA
nr:MFS transporter [Planococcus glaciei]